MGHLFSVEKNATWISGALKAARYLVYWDQPFLGTQYGFSLLFAHTAMER